MLIAIYFLRSLLNNYLIITITLRTTGIIVLFKFHIHISSIWGFLYLDRLSNSYVGMFLSIRITMSIKKNMLPGIFSDDINLYKAVNMDDGILKWSNITFNILVFMCLVMFQWRYCFNGNCIFSSAGIALTVIAYFPTQVLT